VSVNFCLKEEGISGLCTVLILLSIFKNRL